MQQPARTVVDDHEDIKQTKGHDCRYEEDGGYGYEVYPVVDASGGMSPEAHLAALERITQAGAKPIGWVQSICELQRDWQRKDSAQEFANILFAVESHSESGQFDNVNTGIRRNWITAGR
jgi:hypothetical protein